MGTSVEQHAPATGGFTWSVADLLRAADLSFYNTSQLDFRTSVRDQDNVRPQPAGVRQQVLAKRAGDLRVLQLRHPSSHGSLLFLQHMIHHRKRPDQGGSHLARGVVS